jgi:hypothetical protein
MTDSSLAQLMKLDHVAHSEQRKRNRARLRLRLDPLLPPAVDAPGTPFGHAVLSDDRDRLIERLHRKRVFATPLWHDALIDEQRHPVAAKLRGKLVGLPIDQRYTESSMDTMADLIVSCV